MRKGRGSQEQEIRNGMEVPREPSPRHSQFSILLLCVCLFVYLFVCLYEDKTHIENIP